MIRSETRPVDELTDEMLGAYLATALRPIFLLSALTAAGLAAIYVMGLTRILEPVGWQMIVAALLLLVQALGHRQILNAAERGRGIFAFAVHAGLTIVTAVGLAALWEGIAPLAVLAAWIAPVIGFPARMPRRQFLAAVAASAVASLAILLIAVRPIVPRLGLNSTGGFTALLLMASVIVLFVLLVLTTQVLRYRTLQARLVGSLVPLIAAPVLFTTVIAAYNSLTSSRQQFQSSLQAVASLKSSQLHDIIGEVTADLSAIQNTSQDAPSIMHLLRRPGASDDDYRLNASLAANQLRNVIVVHPTSDYEEVLVMDLEGNVIISTYLLNQGVNFSDQEFFRLGLVQSTVRLVRYPGNQNAVGEYRLVVAAPFYGQSQDEILGVVVGVALPDAVFEILQPTAGLEGVSTYLVGTDFDAVTPAAGAGISVPEGAFGRVISERSGVGSETYRNYAGVPVLGYFAWDSDLGAVLVSEVPQGTVFARSLAAVLASALVGIITIVIAGIAVLSAARAISEPVTALAATSEQLAGGQLSARARADRDDEIGRLAESFNTMAAQMQGSIAGLEERVAERTRALEQQTLRLRTAAEVARDAALAPTLEELLKRAAQLVLDRFGVDDVAIYLLDDKHQYAVLQAAPSPIGRRMLASSYRVPVGARSPVGQAADSGEPQLVLRGRGGPVDPGDEFHPDTQSQLTLPLRTNEGTIGLLDLQSMTPGLFSQVDTATLQVLADQLAAAVERSRLMVQVQQRLGQLEQTYRRFTEDSWSAYTQRRASPVGYRYDNLRLDSLAELPEEVQEMLGSADGAAVVSDSGKGGARAHLPIRLRGQTLGVITVNFRESKPPARTIALLEQAVERLGSALENVRLLEDSLRRASKERTITEITSRVGSSISVRNVLQTAVEELGRALPGTEVSINFRPQGATNAKEQSS